VVVPVAVESSGAPGVVRDVAVVAYAADPVKRRLDYILETWQRTRRDGETLVVTGIERAAEIPGVRFTGRLAPDAFRALLRRARVFVAASRREEFGIAQLEALADGAMLVTTPAPGTYLATALRAALDDPAPGYGARAAELVAPFARDVVARTLSQHVLPRLLAGWGA
jgi:glycosyltransferase involved in cell wall biosynthesis